MNTKRNNKHIVVKECNVLIKTEKGNNQSKPNILKDNSRHEKGCRIYTSRHTWEFQSFFVTVLFKHIFLHLYGGNKAKVTE